MLNWHRFGPCLIAGGSSLRLAKLPVSADIASEDSMDLAARHEIQTNHFELEVHYERPD
jgi:hypothetical protein